MTSEETPRVLVIDDERLYCQAIADILQSRGYAAQLAYTAQAGLLLIERFRPHLVIADVMMPDMDGISLLREAATLDNGARPAWVVCSAKVSSHDRENAMRAGADAFLAKPFSMQDLLRTVTAVLSLRPTQPPPVAA